MSRADLYCEPIAAFGDRAQAGMLSINQARPHFSPAGPFSGWKNSGFDSAEHGHWNRDAYTRPQAIYRSPGCGSTSR